MIMAQEQSILKAQQQLDQAAQMIRQATRDVRPIDQVERDLWQQMLGIGLSMLHGFVAGQGDGDVGPTLEHEGHTLRRLDQQHERRYVSVFGELHIGRTVYATRKDQKHQVVPLDAVLNLPDSDFGYLLQQWDQSFCVQDSYASSRQTVQQILGIGQSVRTLEQMNASMSHDVELFNESQPAPAAQEEGSIVVLTADGKGVPMRRDEDDSSAIRGRRKKGEKANKKRQACVGAVYTVEPFVRTAQDVVDEVMRDKRKHDRPQPQHKQVRAELTRPIDGVEIKGKTRIFAWFAQQLQARNRKQAKDVVCLLDGERALWKMLALWIVPLTCVVGVLDIFHVLGRLWTAAHCFHPEGSEEAQTFVTQRLERILQGDVGRVIGGLKQMATKSPLRGIRAKRLSEVVGYLQHNRAHMHYDEYLAKGYPIGSGVAEGACRHLVKDRLELTGMRWRIHGAQSMLDLRSVFLNNQWDKFQSFHIEQATQRLYPYRNNIIAHKHKTAA